MCERDVFVISSINKDITLSLERFPARGETTLAQSTTTSLGGKGANAAVAAAKSSYARNTLFVGAIGADGKSLLSQLQSYGVDVSHVSVLEQCVTGLAVIVLESRSGENRIIVELGANCRFETRMCAAVYEAFSRAVVVLHFEMRHDVVQQLAVDAARMDALVVLNASPVPTKSSVLFDEAARIWSHVHVLIVNQVELEQLTGVKAELSDDNASLCSAYGAGMESLRRRCEKDAKLVVTLGGQGVVFSERDGHLQHVAAVKTDTVVDTTGAGDTFTGYVAAALSQRLSFATCVRAGVAAASLCVRRRGAAAAVPDGAEVQVLLSSLN